MASAAACLASPADANEARKPAVVKRALEMTEESMRVLKSQREHLDTLLEEHTTRIDTLRGDALAAEVLAEVAECNLLTNASARLVTLAELLRTFMHSEHQVRRFTSEQFVLSFDHDDHDGQSGCVLLTSYVVDDAKVTRIINSEGSVFFEGDDEEQFNMLIQHPRVWDF